MTDEEVLAVLNEIREDLRIAVLAYGLDTPEGESSLYHPAIMARHVRTLLSALEERLMDNGNETTGTNEMVPPTDEQCSAKEPVEIDGCRGVAQWWPRWGAITGKAVMFTDPGGGVDMIVWHDGECPSTTASGRSSSPRPRL